MHEKKKKKKEIMLIYAHVMDLNYKKKKNPKFRPSRIGASQSFSVHESRILQRCNVK